MIKIGAQTVLKSKFTPILEAVLEETEKAGDVFVNYENQIEENSEKGAVHVGIWAGLAPPILNPNGLKYQPTPVRISRQVPVSPLPN